MFANRTLREVIDGISEAAKDEAMPPHLAGRLLAEVMCLRGIHDDLYHGTVIDHRKLGEPVYPER